MAFLNPFYPAQVEQAVRAFGLASHSAGVLDVGRGNEVLKRPIGGRPAVR